MKVNEVIHAVYHNGAVQYRMVQSGTIQNGTVRYNTEWYSTAQYRMVQSGTIQYGTVRYNTVWYSPVQYRMVQYNSVRYCTIHYNLCVTLQYNTVRYHYNLDRRRSSDITGKTLGPCSSSGFDFTHKYKKGKLSRFALEIQNNFNVYEVNKQSGLCGIVNIETMLVV